MEFLMTFLDSTWGLVILVYFAIGLIIIKIIEIKDSVSVNVSGYIICMITWLPYIIWGMIDGLRGKPPPQ